MWRSRQRYTFNHVVGRIVLLSDRYRLVNARGQHCEIDQSYAGFIHETEEKQVGRPPYFPSESVSAITITLPDRLWAKLKKPYSPTIAGLVERTCG